MVCLRENGKCKDPEVGKGWAHSRLSEGAGGKMPSRLGEVVGCEVAGEWEGPDLAEP